jgi:hypothetical protein
MAEKDIVKTAQDLYRRDKDAWADIYKKAKEDLRFLSDEPDAQWDSDLLAKRKALGMSSLTLDQLGQFVHQVANDVLANTPTINVIPDDGTTDLKTAEAIKGKVKDIEYKSNADTAYDTAVKFSIKSSIGFIFIDREYTGDENFNQELRIRRCVNPLAVLLDSTSIEADGSDAMHGTKIEEITVAEFKKRYKGKDVCSFGDEESKAIPKDDDKVKIAEFFQIVEEGRDIGATETGDIEDAQDGVEYKSRRTVKKRTVKHYTLSAKDILEETVFPGDYVPIVPVYGEEAWEDGKRKLHSLIRKSKKGQQLFNLWKSLETDLLMKQPQASVMAAVGQTEDFAADYQNPTKPGVLRYHYKDAAGNPVGTPQILPAPPIPTGVVNASRMILDDIKGTMGIYNAALGQKSNETSGVAINQRKLEGDMATYHFGDNLVKSITHVGRILVCAFPAVYDTPRIINTIGHEDEPKRIGINGAMAEGQEQSFDFTKGKYSVKVVTGAPTTTLRQEAAQFYADIATKVPDLMPVMGDLMFKYQDFAGAQAMAERMKKVVDPKFLEDGSAESQKIAELSQASQQQQQVIAELQQQLEAKTENEQTKNQLEIMKIQADAEKTRMEMEYKAAELRLKERELGLRQIELMSEIEARKLEAARPAEVEPSGSMQ